MDHQRRILLKSTLAASATTMAISAGLLTPKAVLAAWNTEAFSAKDVNAALTNAFGSTDMPASDKIKLKAPELAQSGSKVTVTVESKLDKTESISFLVQGNAQPLSASFSLGPRTEGFISTNLKMGKSSDVIAVVKADGKLYSVKQHVKVTIGGCGG